MRVGVVGTGYVGVAVAAGLADKGNEVVCVDVDPSRVASLSKGILPISEPGVGQVFADRADLLSFSTSYDVLSDVDLVFVCVPTPVTDDGVSDLRFLWSCADSLAGVLPGRACVVVKSTVLPGTCDNLFKRFVRNSRTDLDVVFCPEFLREGSAFTDFLSPSRIVFGCVGGVEVPEQLLMLFEEFPGSRIETSATAAEVAKVGANIMLASRLTMLNSLASVAVSYGAKVSDVVSIMTSDPRIGTSFAKTGPGWGGSCFEKDTLALSSRLKVDRSDILENFGFLLDRIVKSNHERVDFVAKYVSGIVLSNKCSSIGVWGLTFKEDTDDTRNSTSVEVVSRLVNNPRLDGVDFKLYDPEASLLPEELEEFVCSSSTEAAQCDVLVVLTPWDEFRDLELQRSVGATFVVDTRGVFAAASGDFELAVI